MNACFLTGPVAMKPEVLAALYAEPVSHRDPDFIAMMRRARTMLTDLVNAPHVTLMLGSGTLANDAVAAQLKQLPGPGLILSNGEFGERLIDHARRWGLPFADERQAWGEAFDWQALRSRARQRRPAWIWAVLTETSTGVANPLPELLALAQSVGADLCLDAVSAIGLMPVDLRGVRFATAVSGKGLAAYPGLAAVFHDGRLARSAQIPRYLDLADYEAADSVPFTHSSNLLAALDRSLASTRWRQKFIEVRQWSLELHRTLRRLGLPPLSPARASAPGIITLPMNVDVLARDVAAGLANQGVEVAYQSSYLRQRNWLQIALMGEVDAAALRQLPEALASFSTGARRVASTSVASSSVRARTCAEPSSAFSP